MGLIESVESFGKSISNSVDAFNTKNKGLLDASALNTVDAPAAAMTLPKPSTSGDPTLNSMASQMLDRADHGFYGHMTIEKCISMSGSKSTLKSDKSSFAKSTSNGMHLGKKRG